MTKQSKITASEARFPLASLSLSPLNPRQNVPENEVIELADSLWSAGLIQNISGLLTDEGGAEIVAGGRRLRALQYLADKHPDLDAKRPDLANPLVNLAPDRATAEAWANTENIARKALEPADEIRAYGKMSANGATAGNIARAFAVTEKHVYRRLALSKLPEAVLDALAKGEINLSAAACFTISDDEEHSIEVLNEVRGRSHVSDHTIKTMLKPDSIKGTDRRAKFVGEEAYKAAGGRIGGDLFSEMTLFDDPELLDKLFLEKLEATSEELRASEGWKWTETSANNHVGFWDIEQRKMDQVRSVAGELNDEQAERCEELEYKEEDLTDEEQAELDALEAILKGDFTEAQKEHAGFIMYVNHDGKIDTYKGLVLPQDKAAAVEAGILSKNTIGGTKDAPKSPISQKLADDLSRVVTGARQHAMLNDPELLIALLAFQLSGGSYFADPIGLSKNEVPNIPTTEEKGYVLDARLTEPPHLKDSKISNRKAEVEAFKAFRKKGKEFVEGELIRQLAALLKGGNVEMCKLVDREVKTDIRAVWTPTAENFFNRAGGPYLNELRCDLLDLKANDEKAKSFAKLKKGEKAKSMEKLFSDEDTRKLHAVTQKQAAKIDKWLPEGMK